MLGLLVIGEESVRPYLRWQQPPDTPAESSSYCDAQFSILPLRRFERGSFLVFDPASWEVTRRDNFVVQFEHLERSPPLPGRQSVAA